MIATATKTPEIAFSEEEARNVGNACMNVLQHYNVKATQKTIDWGNLLVTLVIVYGGKFMMISERQNAERKAKRDANIAATAPFFGATA